MGKIWRCRKLSSLDAKLLFFNRPERVSEDGRLSRNGARFSGYGLEFG
jgi:hypothetical protein